MQAFNNALANTKGIRLTLPENSIFHAGYKYYFFVEPECTRDGWNRDKIVAEIHSRGVPCFTGTCPEIYREKAFTDLYDEQESLPVAKTLGETSVMMNVHPGMTPELINQCADVVRSVMDQASG